MNCGCGVFRIAAASLVEVVHRMLLKRCFAGEVSGHARTDVG